MLWHSLTRLWDSSTSWFLIFAPAIGKKNHCLITHDFSFFCKTPSPGSMRTEVWETSAHFKILEGLLNLNKYNKGLNRRKGQCTGSWWLSSHELIYKMAASPFIPLRLHQATLALPKPASQLFFAVYWWRLLFCNFIEGQVLSQHAPLAIRFPHYTPSLHMFWKTQAA